MLSLAITISIIRNGDNMNESQKKLILKTLKNGAVLTQMDVYQEPYRCTRLAAVISVLRSEGYNIITKKKKNSKRTGTHAEYRLIP